MELNLDEWSVEGFLINRNDKRDCSVEEYLKVKAINLNETIKEHFRESLRNYLCNDSGVFILNLGDFNEFMSDDSKYKKYHISKRELSSQINYFDDLIIKINEDNQDLATNNFSEYHTIVLKFTKQNQEILCFRKLQRVKSGGVKRFSIHGGEVDLLEDDFIYFDDSIDIIFFSNFNLEGDTPKERKRLQEKILIFNRESFTTLFRFKEYCINKSREFFENLDFIEVADVDTDKKDTEGNPIKLKESFVTNNNLNKQITRVYSISGDEITFNKIKDLKEEKRDKLKYNIENNKVKIETQEQIKDLLDLIDEKIATPLWNKEKDLRFHSKGDNL